MHGFRATLFSWGSCENVNMRTKAVRDLAIAHKNDGKSTKQIAAMLRVSQRTIRNWFKQGPMHPMQGIRKIDRAGRRTSSPIQEEGLLAFIEDNPGQTLADISTFISSRYCVTVSCKSVSRILNRNHITRKRGTKQNIKYDRSVPREGHALSGRRAGLVLQLGRFDRRNVGDAEPCAVLWICQARAASSSSDQATGQENRLVHAHAVCRSSGPTSLGLEVREYQCRGLLPDIESFAGWNYSYAR